MSENNYADFDIDSLSEEEYFAELHDRLQNDYKGWFQKGITRKEAADSEFIRFQQIQNPPGGISVSRAMATTIPNSGPLAIYGIYLELMAQSFELLLKGLMVKATGKFEYSTMKTHNLKNLWEKIVPYFENIGNLNETEDELLKKLSGYSTWAGKYPAPLTKGELKDIKPKKFNRWLFNHSKEEVEILNNLFKRLEVEVNKYLL